MTNELQKMEGMTPSTFNEAKEFSELVSKSDFVPVNYKGKPADILICIQMGHEVGLKPIQALQNIAVINGKPSLYGDSAIALCRVNPDFAGIEEKIIGSGAERKAVCTVQRLVKATNKIEKTIREFAWSDATRAGLTNRGPWKSYPDRMLQMRARGFALRDAFPDSLKGLITKEEAEDFPQEEQKNTVEIEVTTEKKQTDTNFSDDAEVTKLLNHRSEGTTIEQTEEPLDVDIADKSVKDTDITTKEQAESFYDLVKVWAETCENVEELNNIFKNNKEQFKRLQNVDEEVYNKLLSNLKTKKGELNNG